MSEKQKAEKKIIDKEWYKNDLFPIHKDCLGNVKHLYSFEVTLPFTISLDNDHGITLYKKTNCYTFVFSHNIIDEGYKYHLPKDTDSAKHYQSKVLVILADGEASKKDDLSLIIDDSIVYLNDIMISYILNNSYNDVHYITKEMLDPIIIMEYVEVENWESDMCMICLNQNFPVKLSKFSNFQNLARVLDIATNEFNPFISGEMFISFSKTQFRRGFYLEAVIYAQIAVEVTIKAIYGLLLKEVEAIDEDIIQQKIEDTPFMTIVKRLPEYLGGNWNLKDTRTEVGKWYINTYDLRNYIVHLGQLPSFDETDNAIYCAIKFRYFLFDRIKDRRKKFPFFCQYLRLD